MNNTDPIIKWGECEQKKHRQYWWSSQEQTKRTSNRDPIKNRRRMNRRHTTNAVCVSFVHPYLIFHGAPVAHSFSLFLTWSPMLSVPSVQPSPVFHGVLVAHSFSLFLTWSPLLSVCHLFTLPQFLMRSLLLILLVYSWLDHQCCLCVFCSPFTSFWWGPCCSFF
jgi:hypothetical protein